MKFQTQNINNLLLCKYILVALLLLSNLTIYAQLRTPIKIDFDTPNGETKPGFTSFPIIPNSPVLIEEISFELFGITTGEARVRGFSEEMLDDLIINNADPAIKIGLRISNLPLGVYQVESYHFDPNTQVNDGKIKVEYGVVNAAKTTLLSGVSFSQEKVSFQISSDGASTYELVFSSDDQYNRAKINGLLINPALQTWANYIFVDAKAAINTIATDCRNSFFTTTNTSGDDLWILKEDIGFDTNNNFETFEAAPILGETSNRLKTVAKGLEPNTVYEVSINYMSTSSDWGIKAGFSESNLNLFRADDLSGNTTIFLTTINGELYTQNLTYVGEQTTNNQGELTVYVARANEDAANLNTLYEGIALIKKDEGCVDFVSELNYLAIHSDRSANFKIESNGLIQSTTFIEYLAGNEILFLSGFEVENGADFCAFISPCQ